MKHFNPNLLVWDPSFSLSHLNVSPHQTSNVVLQNGKRRAKLLPGGVLSFLLTSEGGQVSQIRRMNPVSKVIVLG